MNDSDYIIRNYRVSDFDGFVRLKNEASRLTADGGYLSPQSIRESLGRPNYSPERDLFLVEKSSVIVGYMDIMPETKIGRVILDCFIHPRHRRKGLATRFLRCASERAKELGATVAHVNIHENNRVAQRVLNKLGFRLVRRFHELRLDLAEISSQETTTYPIIRHLQAGEEGKLTEIQNRSFAGSWGFSPNTEEEVRYVIGMSGCAPEGVLLVCEEDKLIGYCWTRIEYDAKDVAGRGKGRISMIGVDPDHRGSGIGKQVLLAGLAYLKSKGLSVAQLTVDSENTVAVTLYRSIGFKACDSHLWYEKKLD